jgi:hypothetical protein
MLSFLTVDFTKTECYLQKVFSFSPGLISMSMCPNELVLFCFPAF